MPAGRPTKYNDEMIAKIDEYLATCVDYAPQKDKEGNVVDRVVNLPKRVGFCRFVDIGTTTLERWEKEHPEFRGALKKIDEAQQEKLINQGLAGNYNSTIAKLILSSNHGMMERQDFTTKGDTIQGINYIVPDGDNTETNS